jgi:transposase
MRDQIQTRRQQKVLIPSELAVGREELRHIADAPAYLRRLLRHIESGNKPPARRGRQHRRQHFYEGAFTRTVRSDEAKDLSRVHRQGNAIDRSEFVETPG